MASSRLGTAGLVAFLAAPGAFLGFACAIAGLLRKVGLSGSLLELAQAHALITGAQQLRFVAFEPILFGRHLRPHDARTRARAYMSRNSNRSRLLLRSTLEKGATPRWT